MYSEFLAGVLVNFIRSKGQIPYRLSHATVTHLSWPPSSILQSALSNTDPILIFFLHERARPHSLPSHGFLPLPQTPPARFSRALLASKGAAHNMCGHAHNLRSEGDCPPTPRLLSADPYRSLARSMGRPLTSRLPRRCMPRACPVPKGCVYQGASSAKPH